MYSKIIIFRSANMRLLLGILVDKCSWESLVAQERNKNRLVCSTFSRLWWFKWRVNFFISLFTFYYYIFYNIFHMNFSCDGGWPSKLSHFFKIFIFIMNKEFIFYWQTASAFRYMQLNGLASGTQYFYKNLKQAGCRKAGQRNILPHQFIVKQIEIEFRGDENSLRKLLHRVYFSFWGLCLAVFTYYFFKS